jgi:hypothetical protein
MSAEMNDDPVNDEIRPEDGRFRYWMFVNGEGYRLFAGLTGGICLVVFCGLAILGLETHVVGIVAGALCVVAYIAYRLLDRALQAYDERDWRKDLRSPKVKKIEEVVAAALWLLIIISVGSIIIAQWRARH